MRWVFVMLAMLLADAARADCDRFKWSVAQERTWFTTTPTEAGGEVASGARAYRVALKPQGAEGFVEPPRQADKPGEFGAVVRVNALPAAGRYQVALSRDGWVDVFQNGVRLRAIGATRRRDCPELAKSVRFDLAAGPAALQFSRVAASSLTFSLAAADEPSGAEAGAVPGGDGRKP